MGVRSETQAASKPQNRAELVGRPVGASSWREASATGAKEARHRDWPQRVGVPGPQRRALWRAAGGLCDAQEARRRS